MARLEEGTLLSVGSHKVKVGKYLSEGGFSKIYAVTMEPKENGSEIGCLKQVLLPDKNGLNTLRKEVDVMKTLRSARSIVRYYDSNAERLPDGSYQVLVLMELCPNKSLLDFMNARIREKLTEKEILKIMLDISIGVFEMHRLKLVHRDIKIENVLIDAKQHFKLCDFGSVAAPVGPPKDQQAFQFLSHDIIYHTTPQYRAPEMIDLYRGFPIDERSDIWALGCFLYKLCYYTTPFEAQGDIAILHALFQFLPAPEFSGDLKNLIIIMLQESPLYRPNIVQIIMLLCRMMNLNFEELGIDDFYHAGPYNFQALHEMQRHKQNELLKQQQYYYEQQKQQQEYELMKRKALSANSLKLNLLQNEQSEITRQKLQSSQKSQLAQKHSRASSSDAGLVPPMVTSSLSHSHASASMKSVESYDNTVGLTTVTSNQAPLSPREHISGDSSDSDVDLAELANLEGAEERYPSLEALVSKPQPEKSEPANEDGDTERRGSSNSQPPQVNVEAYESPNFALQQAPVFQSEGTKANAYQKSSKPSAFENVEAWQKLPVNSMDKKAEKLVDEIFVSTTGSSLARATSMKKTKSASEIQTANIEDAKLVEMARSKSKDYSEVTLQPPVAVPAKQPLNTDTFAPSAAPVAPVPPVVPVASPVQAAPINPATLSPQNLATAAFPASSQLPPQPQPIQSNNLQAQPNSYKSKSYIEPNFNSGKERREGSNPWGDALDKTAKPDCKAAQNSKPFDLSGQTARLSLDDKPKLSSYIPTKPTPAEQNLIELEVGLSSSSSDIPPPLPPHPPYQYEEVSLLDLDMDEKVRATKATDGKHVFKKLTDMQNQPLAFQEQVIDFASDDENNNSEMSRVAIRKELRKPKLRKSSSEHKRSDSHEGRKRLSFFAGSAGSD